MLKFSEKLKSLGVRVGARDLPRVSQSDSWPISHAVPGRDISTPFGETYLVEATYPSPLKLNQRYRQSEDGIIEKECSLEFIGAWAGESRIQSCPRSSLTFLDIETTGLAGGTGTYAFLVGIAHYDNDHLYLSQFFMRDPSEEPAHLYAIEECLASCEVLVTFNGKAFDVPLLATRYLTHGYINPLSNFAQLDLLHLSRRLWRDRLPSRSLGSLEVEILGLPRTTEDIPGWLIPQMYFEYLHTGDARKLVNVFYHNAMDVISMASLLNHISHLLNNPLHANIEYALDLLAISRIYDDLDRWQEAIPLYQMVIERFTDDIHHQEAIRRLASLYKRRGNWEGALPLWQQAAEVQQLYAFEELAKYHEHHARNPHEAMHWTLTALEWLNNSACPDSQRLEWMTEFQHRLERLIRKTST